MRARTWLLALGLGIGVVVPAVHADEPKKVENRRMIEMGDLPQPVRARIYEEALALDGSIGPTRSGTLADGTQMYEATIVKKGANQHIQISPDGSVVGRK